MAAFEDLGVMEELVKACNKLEWYLPQPVQAEAVPLILGGGDVCISSETGSGKTGAFALPLIQLVFEAKSEKVSKITGLVKDLTSVIFSVDTCEDGLNISPNGLTVSSNNQQAWLGGRLNVGVKSGSYYYEVKISGQGLVRVGWATAKATPELGTDAQSVGFGSTGKFSFNRQFDTYGQPFTHNDTIGCFIDFTNHTLCYSKNGTVFPNVPLPGPMEGEFLFPSFTVKGGTATFNFGETFAYKPRSTASSILVCEASASSLGSSGQTAPAQGGHGGGGGGGRSACLPTILVIEPARELAEQTMKAMVDLSLFLPPPGLKAALLIGGADRGEMLRALAAPADIVIATTGMLQGMLRDGLVGLSALHAMVIDEADRILSDPKDDSCFRIWEQARQEVTLSKTVSAKGDVVKKRLQTILVSATLHTPEMLKAIEKMQEFPTWVDLKGAKAVPDTVHHAVVWVETDAKMDVFQHIATAYGRGTPPKSDLIYEIDHANTSEALISRNIKALKPWILKNTLDLIKPEQAIIFARTKLDCDNLEEFFQQFGVGKGKMVESPYACVVLHADRMPQERKANLAKFQAAEVKYLICTDVAARGLDIQQLPLCINYTLPATAEDYIHRTGRVGRADRWGLAVSLVAKEKEKVWYHKCQSRGKNCKNTRLVTENGCCIWYDEPQLWKDVVDRLNNITVPTLTDHLQATRGNKDGGKAVVYGADRSVAGGAGVSHSSSIASAVDSLRGLEQRAQLSYLNFTSAYGLK